MSAPDLSIIIPSVNSFEDLDDCLRALHQNQDARLEILVIDRLGILLRHWTAQAWPEVTILPVPEGTTIPRMRAIAIAKASAPAIAVIEDHVMVPPGWARAMLDALGDENDIVAGAVENAATGKLVDWAAFLCEYSAAIPPLPAGPADGLPGNNTIYRTDTLRRYSDVLDEGKWENRLHDAMKADGITLIQQPDIVIGHKMHYTFWLYMSQRYLYSRSYAGARSDGMPLPKRLIMGAASLGALPPLQFLRTFQRIWPKNKHRGELIKSIPMLAAFCVSWGVGEAVGYVMGAGDALSKVR